MHLSTLAVFCYKSRQSKRVWLASLAFNKLLKQYLYLYALIASLHIFLIFQTCFFSSGGHSLICLNIGITERKWWEMMRKYCYCDYLCVFLLHLCVLLLLSSRECVCNLWNEVRLLTYLPPSSSSRSVVRYDPSLVLSMSGRPYSSESVCHM